jgi:hypothetical protein
VQFERAAHRLGDGIAFLCGQHRAVHGFAPEAAPSDDSTDDPKEAICGSFGPRLAISRGQAARVSHTMIREGSVLTIQR